MVIGEGDGTQTPDDALIQKFIRPLFARNVNVVRCCGRARGF
ncbi:hypothetical protein X729_02780 [Mesorhizobium sp. L103C131B0]|nr:hypothetical protein X729_02780 [Mesorhizobium sp. L103C131B0]